MELPTPCPLNTPEPECKGSVDVQQGIRKGEVGKKTYISRGNRKNVEQEVLIGNIRLCGTNRRHYTGRRRTFTGESRLRFIGFMDFSLVFKEWTRSWKLLCYWGLYRDSCRAVYEIRSKSETYKLPVRNPELAIRKPRLQI